MVFKIGMFFSKLLFFVLNYVTLGAGAPAQSFGRSRPSRPIGPPRAVGSTSIQVAFFLLSLFAFRSEKILQDMAVIHHRRIAQPPSPVCRRLQPPPCSPLMLAMDAHNEKSCQKAAICRRPC